MKKSISLMGMALCLLVLLFACEREDGLDLDCGDLSIVCEEYQGHNDEMQVACDEGVATFNVEIIEIHSETQDGLENGTILARGVEEQVGNFVFNHLELPDIGVSEGDVVRITVLSPWNEPDPTPVIVLEWSLIE